MGKKVYFTHKQERQIIAFFENSHDLHICPHNISDSAIMALFRTCRDYANAIAGNNKPYGGKGVSKEERDRFKQELIEKLDMLSIRYYYKL